MIASFAIRNAALGIRHSLLAALRGIDADFKPENADAFRRDLHPDPRADYVLSNPPFNDPDTALRVSAILQSEASPQVVSEAKDNFRKDGDVRWQFGVRLCEKKARFALALPAIMIHRAFF